MRDAQGEASVFQCDEWTDTERRVMGETLRAHFRVGPAGPFGEYDPTSSGAVVTAELVSRGFDVETTLASPGDAGPDWHQCRVAAPDGAEVVVRAPSYDQALAQAAVWSLSPGGRPTTPQ